jgi:hypothetical protein
VWLVHSSTQISYSKLNPTNFQADNKLVVICNPMKLNICQIVLIKLRNRTVFISIEWFNYLKTEY